MRVARRQARGFALLVVLWTLAFLALLATQLATAGRTSTMLAGNLRAAAMVETAASGAVQEAIFRLLDATNRHWRADGTKHAIRIGPAIVAVSITNEGARLNPNLAPELLLEALIGQLDPDSQAPSSLAAAIMDWRTGGSEPRPHGAKAPQYRAAGRDYAPPGTAFRSVDELGLVLGMTPALLDRLRDHLTVFTDANPVAASGDSVVDRAIQAASRAGMPPDNLDMGDIQVVAVTVAALGPDRSAMTLRVVVRLNGIPHGLPYEILAMQRGVR